jgi:hypothetical protein
VTADSVSVGLKFMAASPAHLRSCINTVGGVGEADSKMLPLFEMARIFGDDGCELAEGRKLPVESRYA